MNKVIIIGCPGSGKTTFAEKLNKCTGLPLYYLDAIWHKPDKTHISREEFDERIAEIFATSQWIIDGNYKRTIETRLKECDTVFLFDLPTDVCIQGATERIGKGRYELPWLETELDSEFKQFISDFPKDTLPYIYELLEKYKDEKQVIIFKYREDADDYLKVIGVKNMIRKATVNDITSILKLYCEQFNEMSKLIPDFIKKGNQSTEFIENTISNENSDILICEDEGKIVGFILLQAKQRPDFSFIVPGKHCYIMDLIITENHRNKGFGTALMNSAKDWAKEQKCNIISLDVLANNTRAIKLYEKLGFIPKAQEMYYKLDE